MNKIIVVLATISMTSHALAWGDREQGAAAGLFLGWLITNQIQQQQQIRQQTPIVVMPPAQRDAPIAPIIIAPPNGGRTCLQHPVYGPNGQVVAYTISCH